MKKRLFAFIMVVCVCVSLCVVAGAVTFATDSSLSISYHLVPILNDTAKATPGLPYWASYNDNRTLKSYATVTAYSSSSSDTASTYCTNDVYVLEGWYTYTSATASIRSIQSASASMTLYADTPSSTQYASWTRP